MGVGGESAAYMETKFEAEKKSFCIALKYEILLCRNFREMSVARDEMD